MGLIIYILYVVMIILAVIGCGCIGYNLGCEDTEKAYKNKICNKCLNYKTRNCPNSNKCYNTLNKPYFKI